MAKNLKSIPFLKLNWALAERLDDLSPRLLQAYCLLYYLRGGGRHGISTIYKLGEREPGRFENGRHIGGKLTPFGRRERQRAGQLRAMFAKKYGWRGTPESIRRQFHKILAALVDAGLAGKERPRPNFPEEWRLAGLSPGKRFMKIPLKTPDGLWLWERGADIKAHFKRELATQPEPESPGQLELFQASRQSRWNRRRRQAAVKKESLIISFPLGGKEKIPAQSAEISKNFSGYCDYLRLIGSSGAAAIIHYRKTKLKKTKAGLELWHHGRRFRPAGRWTWRELLPRQKRVLFDNPPGDGGRKVHGIEATRRMMRQLELGLKPMGGSLAAAALKGTESGTVATVKTARAEGSGRPPDRSQGFAIRMFREAKQRGALLSQTNGAENQG